jgi:hypothetical protein
MVQKNRREFVSPGDFLAVSDPWLLIADQQFFDFGVNLGVVHNPCEF